MKKSTTKASTRTKHMVAMFKRLKREQIDNVKVLMKVMPKMIAARAQTMTARERQRLEEKIQYCKDRVRFCYFLYTDAAALLGPKPKWLTQ
jgi:hypothetical protein